MVKKSIMRDNCSFKKMLFKKSNVGIDIKKFNDLEKSLQNIVICFRI